MLEGQDKLPESTRDIAVVALEKIQSHEKLCADRYARIEKICLGVLGAVGVQVLTKLLDYYHVVISHN